MTVLKCLWRVLDFCRRLVLNLIFLGVLAAAALIWLFARPNTPAVEPGTLLVLDLDGTVVESDPLRSISADLKSLMKSRGASTRLIDVTEALRFAGSDERIAGVIIKVDGLTKLGLASARTDWQCYRRLQDCLWQTGIFLGFRVHASTVCGCCTCRCGGCFIRWALSW